MLHRWKICICLLLGLNMRTGEISAQVLTADDLVRAGISRLSDILELADDWIGSSTEGYHWAIAPLGASWEASPDWHLFVDGQPIHIQVLNRQSLNTLPLSIAGICKVQLHAHPVIIQGILASGGAIQITRCTPQTGISLKGQLSAGNETGDPGPYRYTNQGRSNVDRTGPALHSGLAIASKDRFIQLTGAADEHHSTDPRIRPRVLQLYQGEKDARILYRALDLDARVLNHRISAGASRIEDLMFLPFMGKEIPLDQEVSYASASFSQNKFQYSLSGSLITVNTRQNPESVSVEFTQGQLYARASTHALLFGTSRLEYGASAVLANAQSGPHRKHDSLGSMRVDATLESDLAPPIRMKAMFAFALDDGILGYELFARAWHKKHGIGIRAMLRSRALASRLNFAYWITREHLPGAGEFHLQPAPLPNRESAYSADLDWTTGNRVKLQLNGGGRIFRNVIRPLTQSVLDSTGISLQPATRIVSAGGHVVRTGFRVHYPLNQQLTLKVYGTYAYPWSRTHAFQNAWHHRLQAGMRGEFCPNDRFSLDLRLRYAGKHEWHEFERAAGENPEFYAWQLPGSVHLHMSVQKRFWGNRLRMNATMRNVLDHPHITHPAGARARALFQVSLQYTFRVRNHDSP